MLKQQIPKQKLKNSGSVNIYLVKTHKKPISLNHGHDMAHQYKFPKKKQGVRAQEYFLRLQIYKTFPIKQWRYNYNITDHWTIFIHPTATTYLKSIFPDYLSQDMRISLLAGYFELCCVIPKESMFVCFLLRQFTP